MDMKYCIYCGAHIDASVPVCPSCGRMQPVDDGRTAAMKPVASAPAATRYTVTEAPKKRLSSTAIGVIIGVVAGLAVVAAIIGLSGMGGQDGASSSSSSVVSSASSSAQAGRGAESSSGASAGAASTAVDYYDALLSYYTSMPAYDERIKACAAEYDSCILSSNRVERQQAAATATQLKQEIEGELSALELLGVPAGSAYYQDYQNMRQLMDDLQHRIGVICESWDISLQYDDPSVAANAIAAPIVRDNDAYGVNIYKIDYSELYPNAQPQKR